MKSNEKIKTALCISGQARSVEENFDNINKNLILPNNPDIFIHTWYDEKDVGKLFQSKQFEKTHENTATLRYNTEEIINDLYRPKKAVFEKQIQFTDKDLENISASDPKNPYKNRWYIKSQKCFSMFYSIFKSNEIKKDFEKDFKYDAVIRMRFDMSIDKEFDMAKFNQEKMHAMRHTHNSYSFQDTFAFSSSKNMDHYCNVFNKIDEYYNSGIDFCPEILLGWHLKNGAFDIEKIRYSFKIVR